MIEPLSYRWPKTLKSSSSQAHDAGQYVPNTGGVLDTPSLGGDIRHIYEVLRAYFESQHHDDVQMLDYIRWPGNRTVFKRLG